SLSVLAACIRQAPLPTDAGLRLISTAPHLTECLCAIGAAHLLVGRTAACDYPPETVHAIPVIGDFGTPWLEPVLSVRPTHVLETVLSDPALRDRLTALHIPVVHVPCTRLDQIPGALRQLGALCGCSARADRLASDIQCGLERARQTAASRLIRPRVLLLFAPDSPITAGRNAFVAALLEHAGGINIGHGLDADYSRVSLEWIIDQDPDLLLCVFETASRPVDAYAGQTGWRSLRAVRSGRVYTVSDLNTVSRPGPRVLDGIAQVTAILDRDAERFISQTPTPKRP
ncbi:MAG: ABC transporter substrate-binding protein, partial [Chloroflexi bacterium]|nr:ABC transporter substrate-binding protein [Chloroflexota bacterium]